MIGAIEKMLSRAAKRKLLTGVWINPDFVKLWTGQTVSKFGTHITGAAMAATAVLSLQATPAQMGLLSAFGGFPVLLFSLAAGVWVDRLRRKPILIAADLLRAVILLSIPIAALAGILRIGQLFVVAGLVGTLSVFYSLANQSYLPGLVRREELVEANARIASSDSLAEIAGPSLGGSLVQVLSAPYAIFVDAATYLFSAASLGLIRKPEPAPAPRQHPHLGHEIAAGLRTVIHHPVLRALMLTTATHNFFGNFIGAMYWLYMVRDLHLSPAIVGVSIGFGGAGALVGTLVTTAITRRFGIGRALIASLVVVPLWCSVLLLPLSHWPLAAVGAVFFAMQFFGDIFWSIFSINMISLRQASIPSEILGRANASLDFVGEGASPLGALSGGLLGTLIGARWTWLAGAIGISLGAIWLILSPVGTLRRIDNDI